MKTRSMLRIAELERAHRVVAMLAVKMMAVADDIREQEMDGPVAAILVNLYAEARQATELLEALILDRREARRAGAARSHAVCQS